MTSPMEPKLPRYMPTDQDVDVTAMSEYAIFADEFTSILSELDRMAMLDRVSDASGSLPTA